MRLIIPILFVAFSHQVAAEWSLRTIAESHYEHALEGSENGQVDSCSMVSKRDYELEMVAVKGEDGTIERFSFIKFNKKKETFKRDEDLVFTFNNREVARFEYKSDYWIYKGNLFRYVNEWLFNSMYLEQGNAVVEMRFPRANAVIHAYQKCVKSLKSAQ